MYIVTTVSAAGRAAITRTGVRGSRIPQIVLGDGSTINVMPGRSVHVTRDVLESNLPLLRQYGGCVRITPEYSAVLSEPKPGDSEAPTDEPAPVPAEPAEPDEPNIDEMIVEAEAEDHVTDALPVLAAQPSVQADTVEEITDEEPKRRGGRRKRGEV